MKHYPYDVDVARSWDKPTVRLRMLRDSQPVGLERNNGHWCP